jgi:hypothetical protein
MKLFKHAENSDLFQIHEMTDDQLVGLFGICLNYKGYAEQLLNLPTKALRKMAGATDVQLLCESTALQLKTCKEYIEFWQEVIKVNGDKKSQN